MISSLVVYGNPVQYSYEISHEYLSGSGNGNFPSRICCDIFGQIYFWKSYFFTLFHSKFFQTNARFTFPEQLFLLSSCFFFEEFLFQNSHFFSAFFFLQNSYFFRANYRRYLHKSYFFEADSSAQHQLF